MRTTVAVIPHPREREKLASSCHMIIVKMPSFKKITRPTKNRKRKLIETVPGKA
jgi:hypothetical protein